MQLVRPTLADDGDYRPGLHPEHPAAVEGCRPVSRGLMLELVTGANVIRGYGSCRLANHLQEKACKKKMVAGEGFEPSKAEPSHNSARLISLHSFRGIKLLRLLLLRPLLLRLLTSQPMMPTSVFSIHFSIWL